MLPSTFCLWNSIFSNTFIDNHLGAVQGYDDGEYNLWFDPEAYEGNYWSDLSGDYYAIDGSANAQDLYPLGTIFVI